MMLRPCQNILRLSPKLNVCVKIHFVAFFICALSIAGLMKFAANAEAANSDKVDVQCYKNGVLKIGSSADPSDLSVVESSEKIDASTLLPTEPENNGHARKRRKMEAETGDVRSPSEVKCGSLTAVFSGEYYKWDRDSITPVVTVLLDNNVIIDSYRIGTCRKILAFSRMPNEIIDEDCPKKWADGISILPNSASSILPAGQKVWVDFTRRFVDEEAIPETQSAHQ